LVLLNINIGRTIGEGTFGKVKLGVEVVTGEKVAVKILEKKCIVNKADVARVEREIAFLKILRHPNVIQLYEIIETKEQLYLIMEYASQGELFDYIVDHQRVDEKTALKFFRQIISGIFYLHSQRIIHRDLKPENLLLDSQNNIKIVDFGLSNSMEGDALLKTACGSPCYAPPEMIQGKKYKGSLADIWSCGVVLFALLCGHLPFDDQSTTQLYKKITGANYSLPGHVSESAKDLIKRMLRVDPNKRYRVSDIVNHPWFMGTDEVPYSLDLGIDIKTNEIPVSMNIIKKMIEKKIVKDEVKIVQCIKENRHNYITSIYYLLLNGEGKIVSEKEEFEDLNETFVFENTSFYKTKMGKKANLSGKKTRNVNPIQVQKAVTISSKNKTKQRESSTKPTNKIELPGESDKGKPAQKILSPTNQTKREVDLGEESKAANYKTAETARNTFHGDNKIIGKSCNQRQLAAVVTAKGVSRTSMMKEYESEAQGKIKTKRIETSGNSHKSVVADKRKKDKHTRVKSIDASCEVKVKDESNTTNIITKKEVDKERMEDTYMTGRERIIETLEDEELKAGLTSELSQTPSKKPKISNASLDFKSSNLQP